MNGLSMPMLFGLSSFANQFGFRRTFTNCVAWKSSRKNGPVPTIALSVFIVSLASTVSFATMKALRSAK